MDYYEILQVHPKADTEAIQAAYHRLRERYDPERLSGAAEELVTLAQQRRAEIEQAYAVLGNMEQRRAYNEAQSADNGRRTIDDGNAPSTVNRQPSTVNRQPSTVNRQPSQGDLIDYRPLPPARREERPKGFQTQPTVAATSVATPKAGRVARRTPEQPAWTMPVLIASGLIAVIAAISFFAAGLGIPDTDTRTSAGTVAQATAQAALSPSQPAANANDIVNQFEPLIPAAQQEAQGAAQNADSWVKLGNLLYDSVQVVRENMPQSPLYQQRLPRWLEASEAYAKALELQPANVAVRSDRGVSLCYYGAASNDQKYVLEGLQEVQQAAQQGQPDARVLFNLGVCQVSTNPPQTEQALASWRQVASMSATDPSLATQAQQLIQQHSK